MSADRGERRGERIGIVMLTAAGDAVHVLPLLNALKRQDSGRHLTWVVQPGPATLVRGHPAIDDLVVFDRSRGWRAFAALRHELATRPFDIVLDLQSYLKAGIITWMTRAPVKLGYDRARAKDLNWLFTTQQIPPRPPRHIQDEYFEFLDVLQVSAEPVEWGLGPWPHELERQQEIVARFQPPYVPLVVGSSKREKDWLPERWAEVAGALESDFGLQPVIVGARTPREVDLERLVLARCARAVSALDSGLRPLVGILDAAALVVSLDTGPLHMSVALGRPVVSLIGYTDPRRTGPYRRFGDLVVDAFHEPGEEGPVTTGTRHGRMPRITVRDVLERVERWQASYDRAESPRPNS
ncbi:MAG TPA: glycosyltransferase family 9 protein [Gemmatimonadaceae bacterium]|nr:glycosyltransferase family 9 protein [Gemmatimonadaceae bacterium]